MFATDVQIYLAPTGSGQGGWSEGNAKTAIYYFKSADNDQYGWSDYMTAAYTGATTLVASIPEGYDRVIFVRFDPARTDAISWTNTWGQTIDISTETGKNLFTLTNDERNEEGKWKNGAWSVYAAPVKKDITYKVKVPANTAKCYIAGDWNADGQWVFKEMTAVNATDYNFEYEAKDQLASFKYKYCAAASWEYKELKADGTEVEDRTYNSDGQIDEVAKFAAPAVPLLKTEVFGYPDNMPFTATSDPDSMVIKVNYTEKKTDKFIIVVGDKIYKTPAPEHNLNRESSIYWWNLKEDGSQEGLVDVPIDIDQVGEYVYAWKPSTKQVKVIFPEKQVDPQATDVFLQTKSTEWKKVEFGKTTVEDSLVLKVHYDNTLTDEFIILADKIYKVPSGGEHLNRGNSIYWWDLKEDGSQEGLTDIQIDIDQAGDYTFIWKAKEHKLMVVFPEKKPDTREKREIVLHAGELTNDGACIILFAYTPGKEAFDVNMTLKEGDVFTAQIPKELDSLIIVRAAAGSTWSSLIWEGEGKTAWNQSYDQFIACDTVFFVDWVLETKYFNVSWCSAPAPPATAWYIKLPYGENDWDWHLMVEEEDGTWSHSEKWVGGGANINSTMSDEGAKYIQDSEMDFGENQVAPEKGTDCIFIWNATTQKLLVKYTKSEGIENVVYVLDENAPMYNLLGVEVDATFKGIVIQNGHKFIR